MTTQRSSPPTAEQLANIEKAFNDLYAGLLKSRQLFETGRNGGREGAIHAIESVLKFLEPSAVVRDHGLHAPLVAVFDALMSLDDGVVLPILEKVPHRGRGRASAKRESIKGAAAFTVTALRATGLARKEAHNDVARILRETGVTTERGRYRTVTDRTIRGWCEDVAADIKRSGEAAQAFDLLHQEFAFAIGSDPAPIRLELLAKLGNLIRGTRSGEESS